jgi:hypothetical protein
MYLKNMIQNIGLAAAFPSSASAIQGLVPCLHCDSTNAISALRDPARIPRTLKHVEVAFFHVKTEINNGTIRVSKVASKENRADILTKALPVSEFEAARRFLVSP